MTECIVELNHVAGAVSRETMERLKVFEVEFRKWSNRINLAAPSTLSDLWQRHILDSAQLFSIKPKAMTWLDLGSGGGFPGAVLAILLMERPGAHINLVESNNKKAAFLRSILGQLQAPATVHICRIEEASDRISQPEIITARALAPLPRLLELAQPWLNPTSGPAATALFHKGRDYAIEIAETRNTWRFDLIEHISKIDSTSRILEISRLLRIGQEDHNQDLIRQADS